MTRNYDPVWKCIYCGDTKSSLGKEHIIPLCLYGTIVLPRSSCKECEKITSKIEREAAEKLFHSIRLIHNFPSRNPTGRSNVLPPRYRTNPFVWYSRLTTKVWLVL